MSRFNTVLKKLERDHKPNPYPVTGFEVILDTGKPEDAPELLEPLEGMPCSREFYFLFEGRLYGKK